jgi:hypothetical protein
MPNPDPSPETRFHKGRAKTGGRQRGTPNKPVTVKLTMKTFTNEQGAEMLAWFRKVLALDLLVPTEKGYLNLIPHQMEIWRESMRYGIGKHANQAPDTGRGDLIFHTKFPLGTDPDALERWFEEEAIRRGLIKGAQTRLQAQAPKEHPGSVLNRALVAIKGGKKAPVPQDVLDAMTDEDGNPLEVVEHELPKIYEPDQQLIEDE